MGVSVRSSLRASSLVLLLTLPAGAIHCSSPTPGPVAGGPSPAPEAPKEKAKGGKNGKGDGDRGKARHGRGSGNKPNIVFVLADDLPWNLVEYMPNVQKMQREGTTFKNYIVTDSLCCPSRTSIMTGKFPHDSGVYTNQGRDGGYGTFKRLENDRKTFAVSLKAAGYQTAMMGKYLNGYEPKKDGPEPGWTEWDVGGHAYENFNYDLNQNGTVVHYGKGPEDYLTDVVSRLGTKFLGNAAASKQAYFLEVATFAPHQPYTPAPRHADLFPDLKLPRNAAFAARPDKKAPKWLQAIPPLKPADIRELDERFRLRAQAVQAVDDLVGALRKELEKNGEADDTYFFFSADNGYHMGDHSMRHGKQTAFDTDINVPLIVVGPDVPAGRVADEIVENIDLCETFVDLADADVVTTVDGRSLVPLILGEETRNWRDLALIEHHGAVVDPSDPDFPPAESGNPTKYEAIRTKTELYVEYATGEKEYYDLTKDALQLENAIETLSPARAKVLAAALDAVKKCDGAQSCWKAQHFQD